MTRFAGFFVRSANHRPPTSLELGLREAISRQPGEHLEILSTSTCFVVKLDISAFATRAVHRAADQSFAVVAGEPLLTVDLDATSITLPVVGGVESFTKAIQVKATAKGD